MLLLSSLHQSASKPIPVTIFLDGLNELEAGERGSLLNALKSVWLRTTRLKLFISGQESLREELSQTFEPLLLVRMAQSAAYSDISLYVKETLKDREDKGKLRINNKGLLEEVADKLTTHADGM